MMPDFPFLSLFLVFSRVHHMTSVISRDTKSSDSLSPLPPATTKPKHTVPHWDSDKAEGHFLRAIWYPALHISWAKLPCLTGAVFFLFLSMDTAQLFGYRICWSIIFPYFHVIKTTSTSFSHEWNYLEHYFSNREEKLLCCNNTDFLAIHIRWRTNINLKHLKKAGWAGW